MPWKKSANAAFEKCTGFRVTRARSASDRTKAADGPVATAARPPADPDADRLLHAPVFVLSPPRSGSTLLRVILNSHPQLHAPIETHIRRLSVRPTTEPAFQALDALGHNVADVEHILWDRVLHRELVRSGKRTLVEKTPSNVFVWKRLATCWPDARFVFLIRHPYSIACSWHEGSPDERPMSEAVPHTRNYMEYLEEARKALPGLTVRYEELTGSPEAETRRICDFLDIPWDPGMITYGRQDHGDFTKGIGDWKDKIRSGTVQPGRPLPTADEIPAGLRPMAAAWGYVD
jgi:hypothetical protein